MQVANYSSAAAFRQALEDRLKTEALRTRVPYDRLRKEARSSGCWRAYSASLLQTAGP
jgi:hypothetical protein